MVKSEIVTEDAAMETFRPHSPEREIKVSLVLEMIKELEVRIVKKNYEADHYQKYSRERIEMLGISRGMRESIMIIEKILERFPGEIL